MRIEKIGKDTVLRGDPLCVSINGQKVQAFAGETIATVLLSTGIRQFRHSRKNSEPRGLFCGMGICFECLVTVNGDANIRACLTPVSEGMNIETIRE